MTFLETYRNKCTDLITGNRLMAVLIALGALALLIVLVFVFKPKEESLGQAVDWQQKPNTSQLSSEAKESPSTEEGTTESSSDDIVVDIKGAVASEGVYRLSKEARVTDAIKKAGGLSADADRRQINLAAKIADGQVIIVPKVGEVVATSESLNSMDASGSGSPGSEEGELINLNSATLADLQTISGIGEKRAQDIIDYRESQGGFQSVDELKNVSGIGDKTLEKLKSEVTVD